MGSIRTAIRLPKTREKEKEVHRMKKESISMPRPLGSPFEMERSMSRAADGGSESRMHVEQGAVYGVGEAI
jgi:hypothetical protein